jgi:hypothetical protein
MDKQQCGSIRRCDFYEASTKYVTLAMQRTITRADLHERFRSSAAELTLEELLERIWPAATDGDHKMMTAWAKLRDVSLVFSAALFQGTRQDFKRIFDLLDADGSETLSMSELVRARILTKGESLRLLKDWYKALNKHESEKDSGTGNSPKEQLSLTFNEFCLLTRQDLEQTYTHNEDGWRVPCRSAFRASQVAMARDCCDLLTLQSGGMTHGALTSTLTRVV